MERLAFANSQIERVKQYIANQKEHHKSRQFSSLWPRSRRWLFAASDPPPTGGGSVGLGLRYPCPPALLRGSCLLIDTCAHWGVTHETTFHQYCRCCSARILDCACRRRRLVKGGRPLRALRSGAAGDDRRT